MGVRIGLIQVKVLGPAVAEVTGKRAMSSALLAVRTIARKALRSGSSPDFSQLVPLLDYVERFPEALHQANEEKNICSVSWKRASPAWRENLPASMITGYRRPLR
jgi:hypothetical protein